MCVSPNVVKVRNKYTGIVANVPVSCNHCYECVRKRKLDWEIRLTVESSASAHTFFGMLTYNDLFYHSDVQVKEIQYYIKRLRYNLNLYYPGCKLKYFLVSELGELKDRLHYHVLYFLSEEFTDTFREFQELCRLSWVKKVPLDNVQRAYRKKIYNRLKKIPVSLMTERQYNLYKWSRRKYDDISLGFATAQMLRSGRAVGSIHYACKYMQKQYNRRLSSHVGYDPWRRHMVNTCQLKPMYFDPRFYNSMSISIPLYRAEFLEYPTFPIRGTNYPVPRRWLLNTVGKNYTDFLVKKLVRKLQGNEKYIDPNKVAYHWHKEPERLSFLHDKDVQIRLEREQLREYRNSFDTSQIENEWQTITIPKRTQSCLEDPNLICHTEIVLPLKWDS